jgi:hypothetical protein
MNRGRTARAAQIAAFSLVVTALGGFGLSSAVGAHVAPTVADTNMGNLAQNERELNLVVDPADPDHLAAGSNQRAGTQRWYVSTDGGRNWTNGALPNGTLTVPGISVTLMSDPSLDFGSNGEIYYSALMHGNSGEPCTLFVSVSNDDGANWTDPANGIVAAGTQSPNVCQDKEHIAVDRANNDNVYVAWTPIGGGNNWEAVFSRDLNGTSDGLAFSAPVVLSTDSAQDGCLNQGTDFALRGNRLWVVYTSFCSGFGDGDPATVYVQFSDDQGANWSAPAAAATLDNVDFTSLGFRSRSHPSIDADPTTGRAFVVYATYADTTNNADGEVMMVSSTDGTTWSGAVRVNQDTGTTDQWMPWIAIGNGRIHVNYFTRSETGGGAIDMHMSYGNVAASPAFTEIDLSSASTPTATGFLGDYNGNFVGSDDVIHPAWGDGRAGNGGATDAYTARVNFSPPSAVAVAPASSSPEVGTMQMLTATVTGSHGEAETFIPVQFTVTSSGSPSPPSGSGTSDGSGEVDFSYTNTVSGTDTVTAWADLDEDGTQDAGETATATVNWQPGPPASLTLSPATDTNVVDETHTVDADVRDQYGNAVLPVLVRFSVAGANGVHGLPTGGSSMTVGGMASFSYVGPMPGDDTITAYADFDGDGVRDPDPAAHEPQDDAAKTWALPPSTDGGKVTGGGTLAGPASFTISVQKKASDAEPKGSFSYDAPGRLVQSITVDAIVVSGSSGTIWGTATLNGGGSFVVRIDVVDGGEPPAIDTWRIRMSDGYDSTVQPLTSGNLQVHKLG